MKKLGLLLAMIMISSGTTFWLAGTADADEQRGFAILRNSNGDMVGTATFVESVHGEVRVSVDVRGIPSGLHGMHIHAVGQCEGPAFTSAAAHFNPQNRKHGLQTSDGPHAGDLPNLVVGSDGAGRFDMTVGRFILHAGATSLFDSDGSALVIHADIDDGVTDATGNSGARIACGVLTAGNLPAPATGVTPPRTGDAGLR